MKIDFKGISEKRTDCFCDGKGTTWLKMFDKSDVKFISGRLEPNSAIGMHKNTSDCEVILILSGKGKAICDGETEMLSAGCCHFCPRGSSHAMMNTGNEDLVFVACVPRQI